MILVTGATGTVGSEVVRQLVAAGKKVRALARDTERAGKQLGAGVELVRGDLDRAETPEPALRGVERLYLLPPLDTQMVRLEEVAIAAAQRAGVRHVVKHSNMGADDEQAITLQRWHRAGEKR